MINVSWKSVISNTNIPTSAKYKVFEAIMRSVMCYSCQTWGYKLYEEVEKLKRFFLKKLFYLPSTTPNYVLTLETGIPSLFVYTLKLHFDYVLKVLSQAPNRLPQKLVKYTFEKQVEWIKEWKKWAELCGVELIIQFENMNMLKRQLHKLLEEIDILQRNESIQKAISSIDRLLYPVLSYTFTENYFDDKYNVRAISLICRARSDTLNLNGSPYRNSFATQCSLCNLKSKEDCFHFLSICPVYKEIRMLYFGKTTLSMEETKIVLNGQNWYNLYLYLENASAYRNLIISEYR